METYLMQMEQNKTKAGVTILTTQNRVQNKGYTIRDKDRHYITINGSI